MKRIWLAISSSRAAGIASTFPRSRSRTKSFRSDTGESSRGAQAIFCTPSVKAGRLSKQSRPKHEAYCFPRNISKPVPLEGNLIKRAWFKTYDTLPPPSYRSRTVQSWDIATATGSQNDYSVCTTWHTNQNDIYLIDVYRGRLEDPVLRRKVIGLAEDHTPATILIEDAGPGMNLLQDLQLETPQGMIRPIGVKPEGGKTARMVAQSAKIEAGHVHLPKGAQWLGDLLNEILAFPNGRHDDQVDSVSQFLLWHQSDAYRNRIPLVGPIVVHARRPEWP
jgi:predicted phage terminase large subunit-like protein